MSRCGLGFDIDRERNSWEEFENKHQILGMRG